ncbi:MAG: hypothetical protein ACLTSK_00925 [Christensenellales bacterium]
MTAVVTGAADIALLGPETVLYVYQQGRQDHPVVFGQLDKARRQNFVGREFGQISIEQSRARKS